MCIYTKDVNGADELASHSLETNTDRKFKVRALRQYK